MALFLEIWLRIRLWHCECAMSHLHKGHPDIPGLTLEIRTLNDQLNQLKGAA